MGHRWLTMAAIVLTAASVVDAQRSASVKASAPQALPERPSRVGGRPNLNGIWQALNTAYWNVEDYSAEGLKDIWQLGAIAAITAGQSVVRGGTIRTRLRRSPSATTTARSGRRQILKRSATCSACRASPITTCPFRSSRPTAIC
jgi:hypothetical protein